MKAGVLTDGEMLKRLTSKDPDERMPPPRHAPRAVYVASWLHDF